MVCVISSAFINFANREFATVVCVISLMFINFATSRYYNHFSAIEVTFAVLWQMLEVHIVLIYYTLEEPT